MSAVHRWFFLVKWSYVFLDWNFSCLKVQAWLAANPTHPEIIQKVLGRRKKKSYFLVQSITTFFQNTLLSIWTCITTQNKLLNLCVLACLGVFIDRPSITPLFDAIPSRWRTFCWFQHCTIHNPMLQALDIQQMFNIINRVSINPFLKNQTLPSDGLKKQCKGEGENLWTRCTLIYFHNYGAPCLFISSVVFLAWKNTL